MYELLALFVAIVVLAIPVVMLGLVITAFVRTQRIGELERRIQGLEQRLGTGPQWAPGPLPPLPMPAGTEAPVEVELVSEPGSPFKTRPPAPNVGPARPATPGAVPPTVTARPTGPTGWELKLGRSVLGWVAVVALVLAAATFLRYAFNNQWIGPQGQLALLVAGGLSVLAIAYFYARRGWRLFSHILFSAGLVVIYLATYGSFGFYHVVSQEVGLVFLLIIIVEAALLALVCNAWPVAFVALLGGLATPLLIHSPHDQYLSLFAYLALLNAGSLLILWRRPWPALGTVAFVGAQGLFLLWYQDFFHPEKLLWALGFQLLLWGLHLGYHISIFMFGKRRANPEDLARLLLVPILGFAQVYYLLGPEYTPWLASVAVFLAALYAALAHLALRIRPGDERQVLVLLSVVLGFVAVAIPMEADAAWVALGWAVMGAALWWFGLRVERVALRIFGAVLGAMAILHMLFDTPFYHIERFWPILNAYALPALGVVACLLGSAMLTWSGRRRLTTGEQPLIIAAGVLGAVLLGWVVSWDLYGWFAVQAHLWQHDDWFWAGQVAVSMWWGLYASALLAVGFQWQRPVARWLALGLLAFTTLKVFLIDMASVGELYRILALFCLALLLGAAAWAYQKARPAVRPS